MSRKISAKMLGFVSGWVFCVAGANVAFAQLESKSDQIQEIVVTAQKRESTVQSTPISITALTGQDLQDRGITDIASIVQSVPGVSMRTSGPGQTELEIRGMTSSGGNSSTVGFYLDDIPMTAPASAQNGKVVIDPNLYDLNRVEVLRGPQGTLYGSGSMGARSSWCRTPRTRMHSMCPDSSSSATRMAVTLPIAPRVRWSTFRSAVRRRCA